MRFNKKTFLLVLLFLQAAMFMACVAHLDGVQFEKLANRPWPKEETSFRTFAVSTEIEIGKAWPILKQAPAGVYVSVGSERSFRGVSMTENATELILIDISPSILRYATINRELLRAKHLDDYKKLRWSTTFADWKKFQSELLPQVSLTEDDFEWWLKNVRDIDKMSYPFPEMFNRYQTDTVYERVMQIQHGLGSKEDLEWWRTITSGKDKCEESWQKKPETMLNRAAVFDFTTGNYLFDPVLYERLHWLSENKKIYIVYLDLGKSEDVSSFIQALQDERKKIGLLDLDNTYWETYLGDEKYRQAVRAFLPAGNPNSILLTMGNYQQVTCLQWQLYFGARFNFVEQWKPDFKLVSYLWSIPNEIYSHMNGKLYDAEHLPPYFNSWQLYAPKTDSKFYDKP